MSKVERELNLLSRVGIVNFYYKEYFKNNAKKVKENLSTNALYSKQRH